MNESSSNLPSSPPSEPPADPSAELRSSRRTRILKWSLALGAASAVAFGVYIAVLVQTTPDVEQLRRAQALRPSVILSSDGEVIGRFSSAYQAPVALKDVSPDLVNALIATEDRRFYEHHGIDPIRLVASIWNTLHGDMQGGSTLTQQLARNLFPVEIGNERSLNRKLREAITAIRLERSSSKQQILESYLNSAPFLYNVRGIEMAARTYFDKSASELDTAQCATLVGMLKGSQRYNPVRNAERARVRRNLVMAQMVKRGTLNKSRYELLREQPLVLSFTRPEDGGIGQARHFVAHLHEQLVDWADAHDVDLDTDGLVIRTTLDSRLQKFAQDAVTQQVAKLQAIAADEWSGARVSKKGARLGDVKGAAPAPAFAQYWRDHPALLAEMARDTPAYHRARESGTNDAQALAGVLADTGLMDKLREDKTRLSAGFIAIDPLSGAIRAWVGSPDFTREQFDHVSQARRQPGSTFKPFVYGAAFQRGMSTEQTYIDGSVEIPLADGSIWHPTDGESASGLPMTLREGLVQSKNTITAQVMEAVGAEAVINFAQAAGVRESTLDPVPSLALGTSPVTLLEMGNAYATLAAMGERREPLAITQIADRNGRVLESFGSAPERVLDANLIAKLVDVMRGVVQTGTGASVRSEFGLRGDLAGKTGTTQRNTDGWFMLMSPHLIAGAWVGFNDARVAMRGNYWGQGGHNALRLVGAFFNEGQKAGLIDTETRFPEVVRDLPPPDPAASDAAAARLDASDAAASAPIGAEAAASAPVATPMPVHSPPPVIMLPLDAATDRRQVPVRTGER